MKSLSVVSLTCVGIILAAHVSAAQTVAVGNCKANLVSYSTISEAVAAVAPNSTVLVCPGIYPEQVTISQPLTLKGLTDQLGAKPIITAPTVSSTGVQILAEQESSSFTAWGPVNISNIIVDGGSAVNDCSVSGADGIEFDYAAGTIDTVEVRNLCSFGILLNGSINLETVNIRHNNIHDFGGMGIEAGTDGASNLEVNITSNQITTTSTSAFAGIDFKQAEGNITNNTIEVPGQYGLYLDNYYCCVTANLNTIVGSNVGIFLGGSLPDGLMLVEHNSLFNNGTGILFYSNTSDGVVNWNTIVQSTTAAINFDCAEGNDTTNTNNTAKHNTIFNAPVGIANIAFGDTIKLNTFYNVPIETTPCIE